MRIDLSQLQNIDRVTLVAGAVLIIGVLVSAAMFVDLTKREAAADKLSKEFRAKEQEADALPRSAISTEGTSNERLERFSSFIVPPALAPQLLEDVSRLAAENN